MVEAIYFLKPAWCGTHHAGLWPEQDFQSVTKATAFRRWFLTLNQLQRALPTSHCIGLCRPNWAVEMARYSLTGNAAFHFTLNQHRQTPTHCQLQTLR